LKRHRRKTVLSGFSNQFCKINESLSLVLEEQNFLKEAQTKNCTEKNIVFEAAFS